MILLIITAFKCLAKSKKATVSSLDIRWFGRVGKQRKPAVFGWIKIIMVHHAKTN
jgi:hypothetical protein